MSASSIDQQTLFLQGVSQFQRKNVPDAKKGTLEPILFKKVKHVREKNLFDIAEILTILLPIELGCV